MTNEENAAAERKRKRLEAWRRRQQQQQAEAAPPAPPVKISLSFSGMKSVAQKKKKKKAAVITTKKPPVISNPFGDVDDEDDSGKSSMRKLPIGLGFDFTATTATDTTAPEGTVSNDASPNEKPSKRRRKRGWDVKTTVPTSSAPAGDALDKFMEKLEAGALGSVTTQVSEATGPNSEMLSIDVGGSMMRVPKLNPNANSSVPSSGGVITPEELEKLPNGHKSKTNGAESEALYTASDWDSDAQTTGNTTEPETDDEEEEKARRAFIEALKSVPGIDSKEEVMEDAKPQLAAEVRSEKQRREEKLRKLEHEAEAARNSARAAAAPEFGRLYNDAEGGVMEEAERNLDTAMAAPDALQVLADLNKKKELKAADHSQIDYISFKKNLYIMPRDLANLTNDEVTNRRAKLKIRVRGQGAPAPVTSFEQCGLSERIVQVLDKQEIGNPFPVQAQCIPCILAGRDCIGIAKTGSGKTLAYILPMLRHIADQPSLATNESGPIGLILAPARELAYQINLVCKSFTKHLGLKTTAVYGGAAVAEQISDLKRGVHVCVATPGRLIDILTMQSGKLLSLQRVTYVVMDEADRMYDMGFAPQISAILAAVRPDRQTVLFSATFPKAVETLARQSLKYPVEVMVGGRSIASDTIDQFAELIEENEKFLRLLQLLGERVDDERKALVFVDTQVRADNLFEQLLRHGYPALSLHGGKEQEDRDSTISDFKRKDGPGVLVATGVAGRGLDVPSVATVINYSCPNHLEDYVHRVGRTGRAGRRGVSYTFVNSADEAKYSPNIVRALSEAGQADNIDSALLKLSDEFQEKVKNGEAKWASSGFKGKGYSYDSSEMNEAQKLAHMEKRNALIEAGLLDPEDEDAALQEASSHNNNSNKPNVKEANAMLAKALDSDNTAAETEAEKALGLQTKITPAMLALPGMKDAILKRAGIIKEGGSDSNSNAGGNANSNTSEDLTSLSRPVKMGDNHYLVEFEINDYPREARWKVTQKETTSRLQDEFQTAVTLKGEYFANNRQPGEGERKLYLHLEATSERILQNCIVEIRRLLNEETLRVSARSSNSSSSGSGAHKYSVLG